MEYQYSQKNALQTLLVWSVAISLVLHLAVLFQGNWNFSPRPITFQTPLTVSLEPALSRPEENPVVSKLSPSPVVRKIKTDQLPQKNRIDGEMLRTKKIEISNLSSKNKTDPPLDMGQIFSQASAYARNEYTAPASTMTLQGNYYGTYYGDDSGTFFFYLDRAGHASGSGHSDNFGVDFFITGNAASNGLIQMSGAGMAGNAHFSGNLNIKTGEVAGSWFLSSIGKGLFSGQHE